MFPKIPIIEDYYDLVDLSCYWGDYDIEKYKKYLLSEQQENEIESIIDYYTREILKEK